MFVFHKDQASPSDSLTDVVVHYSSPSYETVRRAADLFDLVFRPNIGLEMQEFAQKEWERTRRVAGNARSVTQWSVSGEGCTRRMKIEREVYPSEPGWTTKVTLSQGDPDCGEANPKSVHY
jgi:hypothetical protein